MVDLPFVVLRFFQSSFQIKGESNIEFLVFQTVKYINKAPRTGLEPVTRGLTVRCSTC